MSDLQVHEEAGTMWKRTQGDSFEVADKLRRLFELEGEAALLLRLDLPEGDPWRPDRIERRAALGWLLDKHRERATEPRDRESTDQRTNPHRHKIWLFAAGILLGVLLGSVLAYYLGQV